MKIACIYVLVDENTGNIYRQGDLISLLLTDGREYHEAYITDIGDEGLTIKVDKGCEIYIDARDVCKVLEEEEE